MKKTQEELLLHEEDHSNGFRLKYDPVEVEGECIILSIVPVRYVMWRYILFILCNILIGIPLLLTRWYPKLKKIFYMESCQLEKSTYFYIVNYDKQVSIVEKKKRVFMTTEQKSELFVYFTNRYMNYIVDSEGVVRVSTYNYANRIKSIMNVKKEEQGLSQSQAYELKGTYGPGTMVIHQPTVSELTINQLLRPFYIFLMFSVIYWTFDQEYYYFSGTLFVVFLVGLIINLYQMVQLNNKIFAMAYYNIQINVLRDGVVKKISSLDVVPGDIVFLKDPIKIPFEGIILEGSALINECALTGESVPVVKKADRLDRMANNPQKIDKNAFVFEGTTIIQVSDRKKMARFQDYRQKFGIPVCVIRTNFVTIKGQLIRIILFPKQLQNNFEKQSVKFLAFLLCISIVTFTVLISIIYIYTTPLILFQKFIDLILITVPPSLPVSMTFGIIYAIERLKEKSIFCIAQNKVITGGMIQFSCFDKTGTLTEDFMDFYCVVPSYNRKFHTQVVNNQASCAQFLSNVKTKPYYYPILNNMASNHSIIKIEATKQLIGDPMEVKLFQFGRFNLNQSHEDPEVIFSFESDRGHNGQIYRRFQFQSQLQRMSVIGKNSAVEGFEVYAKGSPEMMLKCMSSSSVPKNYNQMLKQYASHGFRVLALANKKISEDEMKTSNRQQIEKELIFNGFEVFQNKLKVETRGAIQQLKRAQIGCVMITGDNTLTGSNISYKCSISDKKKNMIICDFDKRFIEENFIFHDYDNAVGFEPDKPIAESYIEEDIRVSLMSKEIRSSSRQRSSLKDISESEFQPANNDSKTEVMYNLIIKAEETNCQLCVTGRAFNQLFSEDFVTISPIQKRFMELATVFARTKPNDKAKIVMTYQLMGKNVSMCGDGANDCGALKQADIGLSLSQAEASISAPFTSQVTNITSMVELIKECRAGLATNFSLFNIMALYSLTQYTTTTICERFLQYPADMQYLYWDLFLNFAFIVFIGYTGTASKLSVQRPRSSLFSLTNLMQMMTMFIIQVAGQVFSIALFGLVDPTYYNTYGGIDNAKINYDLNKTFFVGGPQQNIISLFTNNIYVATVVACTIAAPWRKYYFTNLPLMGITIIILVYNQLMILVQQVNWDAFKLVHIQNAAAELRWYIFYASAGFSILIYVNQKLIMEPFSGWLIKKYPKSKWL